MITKKFLRLSAALAVVLGLAWFSGCACVEERKPMPEAGCDIRTDLLHMTKAVPREAAFGETIAYDIHLKALKNTTNVLLTERLQEGVTFVKSEPAATVQGKDLLWRFMDVKEGQTITIKMWVKADREGNAMLCSSIRSDPQCCETIMIGRPAISIAKDGPTTAKIGERIPYTIVVRNTGSTVAKDVVINDPVPQGFEEESGKSTLSFQVGDLKPGESKEVQVMLKGTQRGKICNVATATSSNAGEVTDDACTNITQPGIDVTKTGTQEDYVSKTAAYTVTVSNSGDTPLTNVVVTDTAADGTRLASAEGAQINGSKAEWRIPQLEAGAQQSYQVSVVGEQQGNRCNRVTVTSSEGVSDSAEACTNWIGITGLVLELVDKTDPIKVGEATTYEVNVTNQGTADAENIGVVVNFPEQIRPKGGSGATQGSVEGQKVTFAPHARLAPKASITFIVEAEGAVPGDARTSVSMTSTELTEPVNEEESTRVY